MGHSVSPYFDFFDRFHCQNYLLDLVRVLTQSCNHSVIFVQINPGVVRCVVNPLGWNDISLQNVVRAVSDRGLEVKHCFDPARLKLGVCLENPSISHSFSRKHTRCLDQVVCYIGLFDPRSFRGIVYEILYRQVPADSAVSFDMYHCSML